MRKFAFRQANFGEYGAQIVIVDECDADLLKGVQIRQQNGRVKFLADDPARPGKSAALAQLVARRHIKRPSPEHVFALHRNGSAMDCRACNLYWAKRAQLTLKGGVKFREQMARHTGAAA